VIKQKGEAIFTILVFLAAFGVIFVGLSKIDDQEPQQIEQQK
jgi:hypothetical protein